VITNRDECKPTSHIRRAVKTLTMNVAVASAYTSHDASEHPVLRGDTDERQQRTFMCHSHSAVSYGLRNTVLRVEIRAVLVHVRRDEHNVDIPEVVIALVLCGHINAQLGEEALGPRGGGPPTKPP
jgi:hypothetical protein